MLREQYHNTAMKKRLVIKFGGAAFAKLSSFGEIALLIQSHLKNYESIIVVVSAMAKMTDRLIRISQKISSNPPKREQDMLISVGERISMSLLAMALHELGIEAASFTGSQSGIITSQDHLEAKIVDVKPDRIINYLKAHRVVIVAGFQGMSVQKEITTLGRGGSDTTAVALAIALDADEVLFYKDVKGIYERDPKMDPSSLLCGFLTYEEALDIIEKNHKKVLHPRAVEMARKNFIPLKLRSFYTDLEGTCIVPEKPVSREKKIYENS